MLNPFRSRTLTRGRMAVAIAIAVATDALQIGLGPLGWTFLDEIADVIAMILISLLIGFHPLLLPTFIVELIPLADMLPTWTGCVGAVVLLRKRSQEPSQSGVAPAIESERKKSPKPTGPVIDV